MRIDSAPLLAEDLRVLLVAANEMLALLLAEDHPRQDLINEVRAGRADREDLPVMLEHYLPGSLHSRGKDAWPSCGGCHADPFAPGNATDNSSTWFPSSFSRLTCTASGSTLT